MTTEFILKDAKEEELGLAVQANLFAIFRAMATLPDSHLEETPKLSRHLAFPTNPFYKGVWGADLAIGEVEPAVDETINWFNSRNAPFFFWWTGPTTQPNDIGRYLTARGLVDMEGQTHEMANYIISSQTGAPGMVADLHTMNESPLEKTPPGFEICDVQNEQDLQDFKQTLVDGYGMPAAMADGWVQAAHSFGIGKTPWRMLLGRLNGKPVATNMIFTGAGVAGVYGVAVAPSARGKGIGAAITLRPLLEARDHAGYNYSVLFSTEMGLPVYERIGFHKMDVRINRYLWRAG